MSIRNLLLMGLLALSSGCGLFASADRQIAAAEASLTRGDYGAAAVTLQNVVQKDPANGRAQLLLARAHYLRGEYEASEAVLGDAVKHQADPAAAAELRADLAIANGKFEQLLADIDGGKSALPAAKAQLYRARGLQAQGFTVEALAIYEQLMKADPASIEPQIHAAECHATLGRVTEARAQIERILAAKPDSAAGWVMRSRLLENIDAAESRKSLDKAIDHAPGQLSVREQAGLLSHEINLSLSEGDAARAEAMHKKLVALVPQAPVTEWLGTQVSLVKGDTTDAVGRLQHLVQQSKEVSAARPSLISALLVAGNYELALREMSSLVESMPDRARLAQLQEVLKKVASTPAGSVQRVLGAAMVADALEQPTAARRIIDDGLKAHPDSLPLMLASVQTQLRMGQKSAALARARDLEKANPKDPATLALLAGAQMANGDAAGALATNERLWKIAPSGPVTMALSQLRLQTKQHDALEPVEQWLEKHPQDAGARLLLAQAAEQSNQLEKAAAQYERVIERQPENATALNNLAWIQYLRKDPRALSTAKRAYDRAAANPLVADTYGWLLAESGDAKAALPILRNAVRLDPGRAAIRYHLAAVLARSAEADDRRTARLYLSDLLRNPAPADWRAEAEKLLASLPQA